MKKNTMYALGGLAVIGVAYYLWNKKHEANETANGNSESYSNATGKGSSTSKANLIRCKRKDGSYYAEQDWKGCVNGAVQV